MASLQNFLGTQSSNSKFFTRVMQVDLAKTESLPGWTTEEKEERKIYFVSELMAWPCRSAHKFGFWPFFVDKDGKLGFEWCSSGIVYSLLNLFTVTGSLTVFLCDNDGLINPIDANGAALSSTESTGMLVLIISQGLTTLMLLVTVLAIRRNILSLWNDMSKTAEKIRWTCQGCAHRELGRWMAKARKEQKMVLLFLFILSAIRNLMELWPILTRVFRTLPAWKAYFYTAALVNWSVISDMHTTFLMVFVGFVAVLKICYRTLTHQVWLIRRKIPLDDLGTVAGVQGSPPSVRSNLFLAQELVKLTEELNEKLKVPMVGIVVSMIVTLTISIFFTATFFDKQKFDVGIFSLFLSFLIYFLLLHVLCSNGSAFTTEAEKYDAVLEALDTDNFPHDLRTQIHRQSMKFVMKPLLISPGNYYVINNKLMSSIIAVLTSYSIVLIQFNKGDKDKSQKKPTQRPELQALDVSITDLHDKTIENKKCRRVHSSPRGLLNLDLAHYASEKLLGLDANWRFKENLQGQRVPRKQQQQIMIFRHDK